MLNKIATKLLQVANDPNNYETTLTITGAGGFGKTTMVISLCYHPNIKENFTDGFVFIELGPQATDPSIKLSQIYHLLTGEYLKHCDINHAEQEIKQVTSEYYHNILVIIDDVWYVEDAEPLVKAFSNCKTILTTRMNNIEQYIPSKQSITIGPMTQHEAICLLTDKIIDTSQLSQDDASLLDELAQDVHLWPLLLSLIRGQLSQSLKRYHLSYHRTIKNIQSKLQNKGLVAFDKNSIEASKNYRKLAVKACVETTFELLPNKVISDHLKSLILWTGIGTSLHTAVLHALWNTSKQEAEETVDVLWAYGLVQFTDSRLSPDSITQCCVEVHAVISQYIIECMDSTEVLTLAPVGGKLNTAHFVINEIIKTASEQLFTPSQTAMEFLKSKQIEIETSAIPFHLKMMNMQAVIDPHHVILILQWIKDSLANSPHTMNLFSLFLEEIDSLISNCKSIIKDVYKWCRTINQSVQKPLHEKNFDKLIQTIEELINNYELHIVAQNAVTVIMKIVPNCDNELQNYIMWKCQEMQMKTRQHHHNTLLTLPYLKMYSKVHKQITNSLQNGSPDIELTCNYFTGGKIDEDIELVRTNRLINLQDACPTFVRYKVLQYYHT